MTLRRVFLDASAVVCTRLAIREDILREFRIFLHLRNVLRGNHFDRSRRFRDAESFRNIRFRLLTYVYNYG